MHEVSLSSDIDDRDPRISSTGSEGACISPALHLNAVGQANVFIQLNVEPGMVEQQQAKRKAEVESVHEQQSAFTDAVRDMGIKLKVHYQFDTLLDAIDVTLATDQI
ncbi:hypothetical protein EDM56_12900 [Brevibacillus fluminis]|uniref:Uncharacterized protein n=2 Tax=Brevibacillus fluminis TaxID=511487 RepID=A0A3M8DIN9_9BACL|nr:hypothetical protein EDM56_12900 [Brevibacillus fluminis]